MASLSWLHISDIHFNPAKEWKDSTARQALLTHLKGELAKHNLQPDLIFCTGDIAFGELKSSSLEDQYRMARDFFDELLKICGNGTRPLPKERLFLVPGNHDVDRQAVYESMQESWVRWGSLDEAPKKADQINDRFATSHKEVMGALTRLSAYGVFVADYLPHQKSPQNHLHYASVVTVGELKVGIAGFNSAWTCFGETDYQSIWLAAEAQFNHMREQLKQQGAELRIGLIHHPSDWFNSADRKMVEDRCEVDMDFWLHGHEHDSKLSDPTTHVTLGAGAITGTNEKEFGYNLVRLDLDAGTGETFLYRYQENSLWDIHSIAGLGKAGCYPFRLPRRVANQCAPQTSATQDSPVAAVTHPPQPQLRADPPFPPPAACLCRGPELSKLAAAALAEPPSPALIHGFGGLGKTELAVHYLLAPETRQHFGYQRYFVSVEGLEKTAPDDLPRRFWSLLSGALFMPQTRPEENAAAVLDALRLALYTQGRPVLLVLDNFETPVLLDKDFAIATLDSLAGLAQYGLALLVTLRDPLPTPRGHFHDLPLMPFADATAARSVLLHWARMTDSILGAEQEAALSKLLQAADGWPISLQMLGILAAEEGLTSLARRCPDRDGLAKLSDGHEENDPHRHPHLSCALTYDTPQLTEPARALLRAVAMLPTGVPEDWLAFWPDQDAVRLVKRFRLLAESRGIQGEPRRKLLTPMRDYLGHRHRTNEQVLDKLVQAWNVWWQAKLPELYDENLSRQSAALYRDMHDREMAAIVSMQTSGVHRRGRGGSALDQATTRLREWAGDVSDWRERSAWLREVILGSTLFATPAEAEEFAQLLAGSQSLEATFKTVVAEALRLNQIDRSKVDAMFSTFQEEIDAWAWSFGSLDLAQRLSLRLAQGDICLESSCDDLLQSLVTCAASDERIVFARLALSRRWNGEESVCLQNFLRNECATAVDSALACYTLVDSGLSQDTIGELRHAVDIDPDYGYCWRTIAKSPLANEEETNQAWRQVLRCAEAHIAAQERRGMKVACSPGGSLAARHEALCALEGEKQALPALDDWANRLSMTYPQSVGIELSKRYAQAGLFAQAAEWLDYGATSILDDHEMRTTRRLSAQLSRQVPVRILPILRQLHTPREDPTDLVQAAALLFRLGLPLPATRFARLGATNRELVPNDANELAYDLLTRGDDAAETLVLGAELAQRSFRAEANRACAETLLCAALRRPSSISPEDAGFRAALDLLLTAPANSDEEFDLQLASLFFDARRYRTLSRLQSWLADCTSDQKAAPAWQALQDLIEEREECDGSPAAGLRTALAKIEKHFDEESVWRVRHTESLEMIVIQAEEWLENLENGQNPVQGTE